MIKNSSIVWQVQLIIYSLSQEASSDDDDLASLQHPLQYSCRPQIMSLRTTRVQDQ